jgi:hypothetical protein
MIHQEPHGVTTCAVNNNDNHNTLVMMAWGKIKRECLRLGEKSSRSRSRRDVWHTDSAMEEVKSFGSAKPTPNSRKLLQPLRSQEGRCLRDDAFLHELQSNPHHRGIITVCTQRLCPHGQQGRRRPLSQLTRRRLVCPELLVGPRPVGGLHGK